MFEHLTDEIRKHAREVYPNEACGFIVSNSYHRATNISEQPDLLFRVSDREWHEVGHEAQAFIHSHPEWYPIPSESDMRQQHASAIPWGIIGVTKSDIADFAFSDIEFFGDGVKRAPLKNRGFKHGITDCYSIIRDWYLEDRGIDLKEIPRDWEWWHGDKCLYRDNFNPVGFQMVPNEIIMREGPQPGDVFLASIRSDTYNHGGVYVGNGLGLHHMTSTKPYDLSRLSVEEPIMRWLSHIQVWVRYVGEDAAKSGLTWQP